VVINVALVLCLKTIVLNVVPIDLLLLVVYVLMDIMKTPTTATNVTFVLTNVLNVLLPLPIVLLVHLTEFLSQIVSVQILIMMMVLPVAKLVPLLAALVLAPPTVPTVVKTTSYSMLLVSPPVQMDTGVMKIPEPVILVTLTV